MKNIGIPIKYAKPKSANLSDGVNFYVSVRPNKKIFVFTVAHALQSRFGKHYFIDSVYIVLNFYSIAGRATIDVTISN